MKLRDLVAAIAMHAWIAGRKDPVSASKVAKASYLVADAMLKEGGNDANTTVFESGDVDGVVDAFLPSDFADACASDQT